MLAKVAGSNQFKVGQGDKTWNELEFVQPDAIQLGGGLATDQEGKIYVDFSQMPTDKFETLLKSIYIPILLKGNLNVYVNGETVSDVLSSGRGLSTDMAFKTIQACVDYVTQNYNLGVSNIFIRVSSHDYSKDSTRLSLPKYITTSGLIYIIGNDQDNTPKIPALVVSGTSYVLQNLTIIAKVIGILSYCIYNNEGCYIKLMNVTLDCSEISSVDTSTLNIIYNIGHIYNSSTASLNIKSGLFIKSGPKTINSVIFSTGNNATFDFTADIIILNNMTNYVFAHAWNKGMIKTSLSAETNPGRSPRITLEQNVTVTGKRYYCGAGGTISTGSAGADFYPGTIAGTVDSKTYSWYD